MMKNIILGLAVLLLNSGAFAGGFGDLKDLADARTPVFEAPKASPAAVKQYDYNFRCMAGPSTPQYTAQFCYLYTAQGQQACRNSGCNWGFGGTPMPSFHCAAASFTPQYVAPYCYLHTGKGQQACVNAGCSWTFGTKSAPKRINNQQNMALRKIKLNPYENTPDHILIGRVGAEHDLFTSIDELTAGGFIIRQLIDLADSNSARNIAADVTGKDAAGEALGLAKYYFITEVLVSRKIYDTLFAVPL